MTSSVVAEKTKLSSVSPRLFLDLYWRWRVRRAGLKRLAPPVGEPPGPEPGWRTLRKDRRPCWEGGMRYAPLKPLWSDSTVCGIMAERWPACRVEPAAQRSSLWSGSPSQLLSRRSGATFNCWHSQLDEGDKTAQTKVSVPGAVPAIRELEMAADGPARPQREGVVELEEKPREVDQVSTGDERLDLLSLVAARSVGGATTPLAKYASARSDAVKGVTKK